VRVNSRLSPGFQRGDGGPHPRFGPRLNLRSNDVGPGAARSNIKRTSKRRIPTPTPCAAASFMMPALPSRRSALIAASFRASMGLRPNLLPCALARSSPDMTRSLSELVLEARAARD
jgi:hypothetical protein